MIAEARGEPGAILSAHYGIILEVAEQLPILYQGLEGVSYVVADSDATAIDWAIKMQRRIGEVRAACRFVRSESLGPRLRCGIVVARRYVKGDRETNAAPGDFGISAKSEIDRLLTLTASGQVICSDEVYKALKREDVTEYYTWQRLLTQDLEEHSLKETIKRGLAALIRAVGSRKNPAQWECLYADRQSLLDTSFESVFAEEISCWVRPSRKARGRMAEVPFPECPHLNNDLVGLALSGGGTRSAVFSVGVLLALSRHGFLSEMDYMSTVSGGGYAGAALTALTMEALPYEGLPRMGVSEDKFPFAFPRIQIGRPFSAEVHGNESPALRHLRQNTELFGTHPGLFDAKTWTLVGRVLTSGLLLWVLFLLPAVTAAAFAGIYLQSLFAGLSPDVSGQLRIIVVGLFVMSFLLLALSLMGSPRNVLSGVTRVASYVVAVPATVMAAGLIYGSVTSVGQVSEVWDWEQLTGVLSPLLVFALCAVLSNFTEFPMPKQVQRAVSPIVSVLPKVAAGLGGILLAFGGVVGFDYLVHADGWHHIEQVGAGVVVGLSGVSTVVAVNKLWSSKHTQATAWRLLLGVGGYVLLGTGFVVWCWAVLQFTEGVAVRYIVGSVAFCGALLLSSAGPLGRLMLNSLSINRIYAGMLARVWVISARPPKPERRLSSFMPSKVKHLPIIHSFVGDDPSHPTTETSSNWHRVWSRDDIRMKHLRKQGQPVGPYPLFCAALNIPGSTSDKLMDRKADSFVIAPYFSGSALTHWIRTSDYPEMNKMRLSQVAAISGAAVSPNSGERTSRTFSIITTLLNIRLGRWIRNSRASQYPFYVKWLADRPTALYWKEMFGAASHEDGQIYLSDGGHFENLGLYELFRRRCRYIVAVSADVGPPSRVFDLGNIGKALRLAIVDFGVSVDIKDFRPLMRDPKTGLMETYYSAATFRYPGSTDEGIIIFIKVGLCEGGITPDIAEFWLDEHPAFPYDSTLNQQFDQPLFESYRHLGYLAGRAMCRPAEGAVSTADRYRKVLDEYQKFLRDRRDDSHATGRR